MRLIHCLGQWFFYENMLAFPDSCFTKRKMMISWRNNIGCIDLSQKLAGISKSFQSVFCNYLFRIFLIRIIKADKFTSRNFFPVIQVKFTKMTNSKNSNLEHVIHLMLKDKDWQF